MLKFSIIIPIYNTSRFLVKCLESCINQTYSNIEIICVDDCSTDNSREIIYVFEKNDKRIKSFFHVKNKSQYIARYTGILNSIGDYILFLDSDDTLRLDACSLLLKNIEKTHADIIQFGYRKIPGNKDIFLPFYPSSKEQIFWYMAKENRLSPAIWTKAYKRSVILNACNTMELFYASGPEDVYTSIVFAYYAESFSFLKIPLINYSISTGWSTRKEYSLQIYIAWLSSYNTVIQKTKVFIEKYIPEYTDKCLDMEAYLLKDFMSNRLPSDMTPELKINFLTILPSYFSKESIYILIEELLFKSREYDTYINFNASFKTKTKKIIKILFKYLKSLVQRNSYVNI